MSQKGLVVAGIVALIILLVGSVTFPHIAEAKKKGKVAVSVTNWNCAAHDVEYKIKKSVTAKSSLGSLIFNFWTHEIECDQPTFTLDVPFKTNGLHNGDRLFACVQDLGTGNGACGDNFHYKPGKKLKTTVDLGF